MVLVFIQLMMMLMTDYTSLSGTSMSSPNVTGTLALLQQHYQATHSASPMYAATLKRSCNPHSGRGRTNCSDLIICSVGDW